MSLTLGIIASSRGNIVPPLDTYGGAAAAYSTRLLSSAYGGSAVRVRRSFDNAEQDIGFSGGAIDETALMNFVGYQNLFLQSETFTNVVWDKSQSTVTPNAGTDPFGSNNATRWLSNVGATIHYIGQSLTLSAGTSYTISFYVKSNTGSSQQFRLFLNNGNTDTNISANLTATTDWQRFTYSLVGVAGTTVQGISRPNTNAAVDLLIYGAQINVGTTAQPYQVTTSAARSGDGFVTKWYTQDSNGENLLLQSQTFDTASWSAVNFTISANTTNAPDGTLTADTITNPSASGQITQSLVLISNQPNTLSFYFKYINNPWYRISFIYNNGSGPVANAWFDIQNKVKGTTQVNLANILSYNISDVGNGWVRVSVTAISDISYANNYIQISTATADGSFTRVGGASAFIWGAQLSQGSWLQPYQVTTTTAILRRDASQSTAANQPRIVGGGVIERENGKAGVRFLGTSGMELKTSYNTPVGAATFFSAARLYTQGGGVIRGIIASDLAGGGLIYYSLSSPNGFTLDGAGASTTGSASLTYNALSHMVLSGLYTGTTTSGTYLYSDGLLIQNFTGTGVNRTSSLLSIGGRTGGSQSTWVFNGIIQEGLYYESNQLSNILSIDRNLGAYYQTHWTGASSGLLDQFGGAAAAYSLRNLSSSYRGPLIRVRRSSDNAETDIGGTYNGDLDIASLLSFTGGQNLLLQSDNFSTTWGGLGYAIVSNTTIAPDGTLTADSLNETAVNSQHAISQEITLSSLASMCGSVYLKAKERIYACISLTTGSGGLTRSCVIVNLLTGEIVKSDILGSATGVYYSISNAGNGWWRVSLTMNATVTTAFNNYMVVSVSNSPKPVYATGSLDPSYLGVAGSGVYVWGAQLNTGILQPYIPTTTAAVNGANAFVTKWYTQDDNYQNLLLQSNSFTVSPWTSVIGGTGVAPVLTANAGTDPFGGNTATRLVMNAGAGSTGSDFSSFLQTATGVGTSTCSIWVKSFSGTTQYLNLNIAGGVGIEVIATNVWQRVSFTSSSGNRIQLVSSGVNTSKTADVLIYGAQLNEGTLTPYTATTTTVSQRRDAIQATAASQPRIVNAGGVDSEGNRPALFFNGTSMFMTSPTLSFGPTDYSAMSVSKSTQADTTGDGVISIATAGGSNGWYALNYRSNITNSFRAFFTSDGSVLNFSQISPILPYLETMNLNDSYVPQTGTISHSINGVQQGTVPAIGQTINNAQFWIGTYYNTSGTYTHSGTISEVEFYTSNQFSARPTIQSNINSYYRIYWQGNGTALLDSFSGASAAYSLRNLSSAYTGPLIRVRRSNDNVERDIYGTFGGDLDIASLVAFVGANSGFVTTWYDQSGNARNATQGTAARQPRIVNAGVVDTENGKPALNFATTQDLSLASILNFNGVNSSFFMTIKRSTSGNDAIMIDVGSNTYLWLNYNGTQYYGGTTVIDADLSTANQYMIAAATMNYGVSLKWYKNGNLEQNKTTGFSLGQAFSTILHTTYRASIVQTSELIVYPSNVDSSAVQIQSNINNYYKIY